MNLIATHVWPAALPAPYCDYEGKLRVNTLVSDPSIGPIVRRSRFFTHYNTVSVRWNLTITQYDIFQAFFSTDLGNGTAAFELDLKYPKNSGVDLWLVRFASDGWGEGYNETMRTVSASLDLLQPIILADPAEMI